MQWRLLEPVALCLRAASLLKRSHSSHAGRLPPPPPQTPPRNKERPPQQCYLPLLPPPPCRRHHHHHHHHRHHRHHQELVQTPMFPSECCRRLACPSSWRSKCPRCLRESPRERTHRLRSRPQSQKQKSLKQVRPFPSPLPVPSPLPLTPFSYQCSFLHFFFFS